MIERELGGHFARSYMDCFNQLSNQESNTISHPEIAGLKPLLVYVRA